jgi:hypothetical protein
MPLFQPLDQSEKKVGFGVLTSCVFRVPFQLLSSIPA